jgi:hypothetical protein
MNLNSGQRGNKELQKEDRKQTNHATTYLPDVSAGLAETKKHLPQKEISP